MKVPTTSSEERNEELASVAEVSKAKLWIVLRRAYHSLVGSLRAELLQEELRSVTLWFLKFSAPRGV